jgi:hypothetical protein
MLRYWRGLWLVPRPLAPKNSPAVWRASGLERT